MNEIPPKKLLVLDLDETLIHSSTTPLDRPEDLKVYSFFVYKRPFLKELLEVCSQLFRIAIWTSSSRGYCLEIVQHLFPADQKLEFIWSEERCTLVHNFNNYTSDWKKDFRKLKRKGFELDDVIVVDDSTEKHTRNYGNLVKVVPWEGSPDDIELKLLSLYLPTLINVPSIRAIEKRFWRQSVINKLSEKA
jgi:carboxy-terminal domain RNA polymerase II polypeptide A small phosphatase